MYLRLVANYDLQLGDSYHSGVIHFRIMANACCDVCSKYDGKSLSIAELTATPVLPIAECTNKLGDGIYAWCTCMYVPDLEP